MPNFSGEDRGFGVSEFLQIFEDLMYQIKADDVYKLVSLRRKLRDTAACLIDVPEAITYEGLKAQLQKTFGQRMTMSQAEYYVRSRIWKRGSETLLKYVLEMEKLRRHLTANRFTETEFVDILLRGMNLPQPYASMLSYPGTIDELKGRMHRFEDELTTYANMPAVPMTRSAAPTIRSAAPMTRSAAPMTQSAAPMTQSAAKPMPAANTEANTRCYNCCKLGHYQSRCPYEKRPNNSCFKCW